MKIRIWNAFASNNSGSYTIVGRFDSDEVAAKVAAELLEVVKAHSAWVAAGGDQQPSPLAAFVEKNRLSSYEGIGAGDDWPTYGQQEHPEVWTLGSQLFLFSDYQVSMPRVFGELIYARGGRVEYEVDHAHHPMAVLFEIYLPWEGKTKAKVTETVGRILRALHEDPRFYENQAEDAPYHAWREGTEMDPDLRLGCIFKDLMSGFMAVDAATRGAGASIHSVRVFEQLAEAADPFAFMRPSQPPLG